MSSLRAKVKNVVIRHDTLSVELTDGHVISAPLTWYPTLLQASAKQLRDWKTCGAGTGISWRTLDPMTHDLTMTSGQAHETSATTTNIEVT